MSFGNRKVTYIWSMCIGGVSGLLFLACFFIMYGDPIFVGSTTFRGLHDLVAFISQPIFYLPIILGIPLLIFYWATLGMGIACGIVWLCFLTSRQYTRLKRMDATSSEFSSRSS